MSRLHIALAAGVVLAAGICGPCHAWLYDGGSILFSGMVVSDTSPTVWVSEPFTLPEDSWVTGFGAAVARGFGTPEMGFNVYLSDTLTSVPANALAGGTIYPTGAVYTYQYVYLQDAVRLNADEMYYLTLAPNSNNFTGSVAWSYRDGSYYGQGTGDFGQSWSQLALPLSIRVDGYVVPEPDAVMAVVTGLLGLGVLRRTRASRRAASRGL